MHQRLLPDLPPDFKTISNIIVEHNPTNLSTAVLERVFTECGPKRQHHRRTLSQACLYPSQSHKGLLSKNP